MGKETEGMTRTLRPMRPAIIFTAAVVGIAFAAQYARGQERAVTCGRLDKGLALVKEKYHETVHWTGKQADGGRAILTTSPEGTWTFFEVIPGKEGEDGVPLACVLTSDGGQGDGA